MLRARAAGARIRSSRQLDGHWGGPGNGYDWPDSNHGITVDYKGNVWIGGNGQGTATSARGAINGADEEAPAAGRGRAGKGGPAPFQSFYDNMVLKFTQDGKFLMQIGKPSRAKAATMSRICGCPPRRSSIPRPMSCMSPTATGIIA